MYNPVYSPLREAVHAAAYDNTFNRLMKTTDVRIKRERGGGKEGREEREEVEDEVLKGKEMASKPPVTDPEGVQ